jgi:hypothetical protein
MSYDGGTDDLILGEIHTGLLRCSKPISQTTTEHVLGLVIGEKVRTSERPIPYGVSPERLTGVDCQLPAANGGLVRGVGTVSARVSLTGGHAVQGSAYARLRRSQETRRLPWSHYLGKPGVVEIVGKTTTAGLAEGFDANPTDARLLDLGSIAEQMIERVQSSSHVDQRPPVTTRWTRLRWLCTPTETEHPIRLRFGPGLLRTAVLPQRDWNITDLVDLCEDVALHDWLLTTLLTMIEKAQIGSGERDKVIGHLGPALDFLLHLWMPAARINADLLDVWQAMERRPGFTRQWMSAVNRVRDQFVLAVVELHRYKLSEMRV